jgi:hypothetical protein
MSGNLASTCHQPMTVFATSTLTAAKPRQIRKFAWVWELKLELASSLLDWLQHTNGLSGLEK